MNMGDAIRTNRVIIGLTQEELGKKLVPPVQKSAVAKWENGRVDNIKRTHIIQMAKLFNIAPEDLLCFSGSEGLSKDEMSLLKRYRQLSDYDKGRLSAYLDMFLDVDDYKKRSSAAVVG